ncbi:MAG: HAMP domain-containing histidine kinase [Candidatus Moranbacteria bacterium]|nr:HAMP domain-containing histidine kinase [Candidatus Moranbacteria bacterium]
MKLARRLANEFNIKKQAENLGVSVWQAPSLMFIMMGVVSISSMLILYYLLRDNRSVETLVVTEALTVAIIFALGSVVIRNFEVVAQANKMKSEFVSIASHQLKTPLSKVSWAAELLLLKHREGLNEEQEKIISRIVSANDEMSRLVKDLLDVARIDQGNLFLANEKIELDKLVEEVVANNKDLAKKFGAKINVIIDKEIPSITGDKRRIAIVIENLISNAIKYADRDGFVEVTLRKEKNKVVCCVKDNGVGIPEDQQDNIFEKFFRSENAVKLRTSGTGLGLYIAKNTIDQSGGDMWFKSIEHVGSLFCFSFPINKKDAQR